MIANLIAAARLYDCDDTPRGPCESRVGLDPSAWCAPCVARALASEVERVGAVVEASRGVLAESWNSTGGISAEARLVEALARLDGGTP